MTEKFPNLTEDVNLQIQEAVDKPKKIHAKIHHNVTSENKDDS